LEFFPFLFDFDFFFALALPVSAEPPTPSASANAHSHPHPLKPLKTTANPKREIANQPEQNEQFLRVAVTEMILEQ